MTESARTTGASPHTGLLLAIAYVGFISLGLPDTITGIAWPGVRNAFHLPQSAFGLISIALGCGYLSSSVFGGKLSHRLGIGLLLTLSSLFVALAMFGSAVTPVWPVLLVCGLVWGLGSGAIDAGLNSFVASHFSARHVNWLHACYSLGATIGPLLMTTAVVQLQSWRAGYGLVGGLIFALTCCFFVTRSWWEDSAAESEQSTGSVASLRDALGNSAVLLQTGIFFLYGGLELTVGNWCYTLLTESRGVAEYTAGCVTAAYFGSIGVGRVLLGAIADRIGVDRLLRGCTITATLSAILFAAAPSLPVSVVALVLLGLSLAPIFPSLMSRTPARVGRGYASYAIGLQVGGATLGIMIMPALAGRLAERFGLEAVAAAAVVLAGLLLFFHELLLQRSPGAIEPQPN